MQTAAATRAALRETTGTLREHRGTLQWYAQGQWLLRAGFTPGRYLTLVTLPHGLEIRAADVPTRNRVSQKHGGATPVIDLASPILRDLFGGPGDLHIRVEEGRILLTRHEIARRVAARPTDGSMGAVFAGAGLADAAGALAGFTPRFAVEIDETYADLWEANHGGAGTTVYRMSAHEAALVPLPSVELLLMGVPCEPFSTATRQAKGTGGQKRDTSALTHAHPLLDMSLWAFAIALKANPRTIVIENALGYATSETAAALAGAFERLGYVVSSRVLDASGHGYLTTRRRTFLIAQTPTLDGTVPEPWPVERPASEGPYATVGDLLDAEVDEAAWFTPETKPWPFEHAKKQAAKGNGFRVQVCRAEDTTLPVFKKRYLAGQGDSPMLAHPSRPDTYRWFTLTELRRIMGVPATMDLGAAKTTAGEVIGQGWHVGLGEAVVRNATGRGAASRVARPAAGRPSLTLEPSEDDVHAEPIAIELSLFTVAR